MERGDLSLIQGREKLRWNPAYHVQVLENETLFLLAEQRQILLKGKTICALAPLLIAGNFSADEIAQLLKEQIEPEKTYFTLVELEKRKLIQADMCSLSHELLGYCGLLNVNEQEADLRLKATKVFVEGEEALAALFTKLQIQLVEKQEQADLGILCVHDYLKLEAVPSDQPWLICKPYGSEIWIGPLFQPGRPGCYHCLSRRLKINRIEELYVQQQHGLQNFIVPTHAMLETTKELACNLIATEVFKHIVCGKNELLEKRVQTLNTITLEKQEHLLIPSPNCKWCGGGNSSYSAPISLQKRKKEQGFRATAPEETIKRFEAHVSPITGIVKYLEPAESLNAPIYVYFSGANCALPLRSTGHSLNNFRKVSAGKGTSRSAAKAGALCEALERASGEYDGDEPSIYATYQEIEGKAIHPDQVLLFSHTQYQNRERLNEKSHSFWKIPEPFSNEKKIPWTPLFSLTEQRIKYYPTVGCYYRVPKEKSGWQGGGDSNGCAAGNCLEEAILQGFLELIERDSIAIWWYNRLEYPSLDLASFQIPYLQRVLEEYESHGREIWVLDISSDLQIPTFAALSRLKEGSTEEIYLGFGAHLDAETALLRSVAELNQFYSLPKFWEESTFGEEGQESIDKKIVARWMEEIKSADNAYLKGSGAKKGAEEYPKWETPDFLEDINYCQQIVENQGMEVLVLDQTRPEIDLKVVRVLVPGLRHFWPRFAPGRLYDVPLKMGKLRAPRKEYDLNPMGIFI
jgi:oxazoline/thiazoline synthase